MDRETLTRLVRASTRLDFTCETLFCPDAGAPVAERPLDFMLRVAGGACTYFSPSARAFVPVDATLHERLLTLAEGAIAEGDRHPFPDTSIGRHITTVRLRVDDLVRAPREVSCGLNHHSFAGHIDGIRWIELLRAFAELASPRDDEDLSRWSFVMSACTPALLTPMLATPLVMPVDAGRIVWSVPLVGRGLYLRLGQARDDTALYRIAPEARGASVLPVADDGREGAPVATLDAQARGMAKWAASTHAAPYRDAAEPEVEVMMNTWGSITVRAGLRGRGVYLQRG